MDPEVCRQAVESLDQAENIYMVDLFYSTIRFALQGDLAVVGKCVTMEAPSDALIERFKAGLPEKSLVLLFLDGTYRTENMCLAIPELKKMNVHVTAISCNKHFKHWEECDEIIHTGPGSSPISSMMIHDLVIHYLSILYRHFIFQNRLPTCQILTSGGTIGSLWKNSLWYNIFIPFRNIYLLQEGNKRTNKGVYL